MLTFFSMYYDEVKERRVVCETVKYQADKVFKFIESLPPQVNYASDNSKQYIADHDPSIVFTVNTFNYTKMGLQGEYKDFYELILEADGKNITISANEEKLRGFCGWINRLTT